MPTPCIVLYFDIASPFAYLAFYILRNSPVFKDIDIVYKPVLLSGILKACKNKPLLLVKNKDKWAPKEHARWVKLFNIPMHEKWPPGYPPNSVETQRALLAVSNLCPDQLGDAVAGLFKQHFADAKAINKAATFRPLFVSIFGEPKTQEIMEMAATEDMQKLLRVRTEEAVEQAGSFGLPWYVVTNAVGETEAFFGFDHIGQVATYLGLQKPTPGSSSEGGWRAML